MNSQQQIYRTISIVFIALFSFTFSRGQALKTYIDRNHILIGEHIRLEIKLNLASSSYKVDFGIPDSIPHFDIIEQNKYDTVDEHGVYTLRQTILFTSFDSGIWKLPAFPVTISYPNKAAVKALSDSVLIQVGYSPADSTNELRDIKPVMDVFVVDRTWIYIAAGVLLLFILAYLLYRYLKNRKKKAPPVFDSNLSPFEEAMKALNQLQQTANIDAKTYHTNLSHIFKKYYSRKTNKNLMTSTTGDLLIILKTHVNSPEIISAAAEALRSGDAAKFAKYLPSVSENTQSLQQVKQTIEHLEKKSSF
jgi:hypothetical protein